MEGGHRVGVTGQIRMEGEKVEQLAYVGSLNIRIAHQKIGCAKGNSALYPNGTESEKYAFRIFRWD